MQSVLVLDDEGLIAVDLANIVKASGRKLVGPATSILTAREAIKETFPDLALLDLNVRKETSWDLARELLGKGCRVIFFSADEKPRDLDPTFAQCIFVRKPSSQSKILEALDAA